MSGVILAVIERPDVAARTLAAAARFAGLMGAGRINVLAIRLPPLATIVPGEELLSRQQEQRLRAIEAERVTLLSAVFDTWSREARDKDVAAEWFDTEGLAESVVQEWGRRADAIVLRRPGHPESRTGRQAIHAALFDTDRPVLMVPPGHAAEFGSRIAIAWRNDPQAIKAVLAGLRCLAHAERIFVLAAVREGAARPVIPDILEEHGVGAELHMLPVGVGPVGAMLMAKAHELGADLLVMGAYRHSPVRELLLGGVTRYMLSQADLPVLMRH